MPETNNSAPSYIRAGLPPSRGTETCTVVEIMNSAGEMFLVRQRPCVFTAVPCDAAAFSMPNEDDRWPQTSGDTWYADRLEMIAVNALPAAFMNGTMWSLNYFQQVNKLDAIDGCEGGCTYCFGMVYECCVSNHVQGWPKFVSATFVAFLHRHTYSVMSLGFPSQIYLT